MITRIYVDNFRTLVNFEWRPKKVDLLLGKNGSGKTSVLDVVWAIRRLVVDEEDVAEVFPGSTRTRQGDPRPDQVFELDVLLGKSQMRYRLVVRHESGKKPMIAEEILSCDSAPLFELRGGTLRFDVGSGTMVTLKWIPGRSALPVVPGDQEEASTAAFAVFLHQVWTLAPDPRAMSGSAEKEAFHLERSCSNFAAWLRRELVASPEAVASARAALHEVIGLRSLQVPKGTTRLTAWFDIPDTKQGLDFEELSDGQRQLVVLYVLRHVVLTTGALVAFDEPDNYVALREIQPWLSDVLDLSLSSEGPQVWFVSHHPELLNQLAPDSGTRFFREGMATRVEPFVGAEGLTAAETIARGWEGE